MLKFKGKATKPKKWLYIGEMITLIPDNQIATRFHTTMSSLIKCHSKTMHFVGLLLINKTTQEIKEQALNQRDYSLPQCQENIPRHSFQLYKFKTSPARHISQTQTILKAQCLKLAFSGN